MFRKTALFMLLVLLLSAVMVQADESDERVYMRAAQFVVDAPNVDIYVDGEAVLEDFVYTTISDYMIGEPGAHTLAVAPAGEGLDAAVLTEDVEIVAGHDYTIAVIGLMANDTMHILFLDETQTLIDAGLEDAPSPVLLLHGIGDAPAVDIYAAGGLFQENIAFGEVRPISFPLDIVPITITAHGDPETIVLEESFFGVPNTVALAAIIGSFPDHYTRTIINTSDLTAGAFLANASTSVMSFKTLIFAIGTLQQAIPELPETQPNSTFFAPTDAAFAVLPQGALNHVVADPNMLAQVLLYHGVQGPVRLSDILGMIQGTGSATLTTAQGSDSTITVKDGGLFINDRAQIVYPEIRVADGIIYVIDNVLLPPMN